MLTHSSGHRGISASLLSAAVHLNSSRFHHLRLTRKDRTILSQLRADGGFNCDPVPYSREFLADHSADFWTALHSVRKQQIKVVWMLDIAWIEEDGPPWQTHAVKRVWLRHLLDKSVPAEDDENNGGSQWTGQKIVTAQYTSEVVTLKYNKCNCTLVWNEMLIGNHNYTGIHTFDKWWKQRSGLTLEHRRGAAGRGIPPGWRRQRHRPWLNRWEKHSNTTWVEDVAFYLLQCRKGPRNK